jgi:hypothetical protein
MIKGFIEIATIEGSLQLIAVDSIQCVIPGERYTFIKIKDKSEIVTIMKYEHIREKIKEATQ